MQSRSVVLLVEDDHLILLHSTMALEDAGYEVVAVPDAEAAIAELRARADIAVLMTDIQLLGASSGIDLAHAARAERPDLAIVITSGKQQPDEAALPEGGRFIAKPYTAAQLRRVLGGTENARR